MTVSNGKTPTGLDEAVRTFSGYVRGENGFDELDFKEWLIEWREQEIAEALQGCVPIYEVSSSAKVYIPQLEALRTKAPSQLKGEKE